MPYFIKTGLWEKAQKGFKGWLDLELALESTFQKLINSSVVIDDSSSITVTSIKQTIEASESSIAVNITYSGDESSIELTLNNTASTLTFPATTLCVSEGVASGNNTLSLSGAIGDRYIIGIKKVGSNYYVVSKNFGQ